MALDYTRTAITSGYGTVAELNNNFAAIETALSDALSRSGFGSNAITDVLDMNSKFLINVPTGTQTGHAVNFGQLATLTSGLTADGTFNTVNTVAEMQALDTSTNTVVQVLGYSAIDDGGGGLFYWVAGASDTADNGIIFTSTSGGTGRWKRKVDTNVFNVKWFGAAVDGSTDDRDAVQAAFDAADAAGGGMIFFPAGITFIDRSSSAQVDAYAGVGITGVGFSSVIKSSGANRTIEWQDAEARDVLVENVTMDVNSQSDFDSIISFDDTTSGNYPDGHNIVIRNCKVINSNKADAITNSWTISAVSMRGCSKVSVIGCVSDGIQWKLAGGLDSHDYDINFIGNIVTESGQYGCSIVSGASGGSTILNGVVVKGNIFNNNVSGDLFLGNDNETGVTVNNVVCDGNVFIQGDLSAVTGGDNWRVNYAAGDTDDSGFVFSNNTFDGRAAGAASGNFIRASGDDMTIVGNSFVDDGSGIDAEALRVNGAGRTLIADNRFYTVTKAIEAQTGFTGTIKDNYFHGGGTESCHIGGEDCTVDIIGNTFVDCANVSGSFSDKPISLKANTGNTVKGLIADNRVIDSGTNTNHAVDENDGGGTFNLSYRGNDFREVQSGIFKRRQTSFEGKGYTDSGNLGSGILTRNGGTATGTTDGSGEGTITHGLVLSSGESPSYVNVHLEGDNASSADVISADNAEITFRVKDASGVDVTSTAYTVYWEALA